MNDAASFDPSRSMFRPLQSDVTGPDVSHLKTRIFAGCSQTIFLSWI
jgi:hypothetical protein